MPVMMALLLGAVILGLRAKEIGRNEVLFLSALAAFMPVFYYLIPPLVR
jgi:hypothetical protein